jgi:microcystin-dependent protein
MADPFMSEIRIMAFNFPPKGWALCNGQLLPINQNQALFSLLGTMYGGNGQTNFALPDLRGRVPMHVGGAHSSQGERAGEEFHTVSASEMPTHVHLAHGTNTVGTTPIPTANLLADSDATQIYTGSGTAVALHPSTISSVGGSQPHENRQPFLVLSYCIALQGIFPSRV